MAKVSIILTLYNIKPEYVIECINSIQKQTFDDWHIYAIDDCCKQYDYAWLQTLPKLSYIRNYSNLGLCASVQKGFDLAADSEYIIRIGSDDVILPDLLQKEVEYLDAHSNYVAVCCQLQKFGYSNILIKRPEHWIKKHHTSYELLKTYHGYGYAGGLMFRSSALKSCKINEKYSICEDFDFHLQLLDVGAIKSIHEPLYLYRSHETNLCKHVNRDEKNKILMQIIKEHNLKDV